MDIHRVSSKEVTEIHAFYDYFLEVKGRAPDRIYINRKQFDAVKKVVAKGISAAMGKSKEVPNHFEFKGIPVVVC